MKSVLLNSITTSTKLLAPIIINDQIVKAVKTAEIIINSLPNNNLVKEFIIENINNPIDIKGFVKNDNIVPNDLIIFKNGIIPPYITKNAGVYVFTEILNNKQYIGSAINLYIRLHYHKDQFYNIRNQTKLHKTVNEGLISLTWGSIYETMNIFIIFIKKNPTYILTKGEIDILVHLTQLIPRILEQSLLTKFKPELNGEISTVLYQYTSWNPKTLNIPRTIDFFSKTIEVKIKGELLITLPSINITAITLGVSRERIRLYLNKLKELYSPILNTKVNVNEVGITPVDLPVIHRLPIKHSILKLENINLTDLDPKLVYAFNSDKITIFNTYLSITKAIEDLCPIKSVKNPRNLNFIARYINIDFLVKTEKGIFYFARHPDVRLKKNMAIKPYRESLYAINILTKIATLYSNQKECIEKIGVSSSILVSYINKGKLYKKKTYQFVNSSKFYKIYPDAKLIKQYLIVGKIHLFNEDN